MIYQILTYLSLIIDLPIFKEVFEQIQNEISNFFNQALSKYLSSEKKIIKILLITMKNKKKILLPIKMKEFFYL